MRSVRTNRFKSLYGRLPESVQREADEAYRRFSADPNYSGLNFERIQGTKAPLYSARVGLRHRAIAGRDGDTWVWFWIGSHSEYDKLLNRLT
ncbi:MAG: hypothetical protein ACRD72_21885 [Candidatus Angelobacter sp.]